MTFILVQMPSFSLLLPLAVGTLSVMALAIRVVGKLSADYITVTRADTGASIVLERLRVDQSRENRSEQARKLLDLVEA